MWRGATASRAERGWLKRATVPMEGAGLEPEPASVRSITSG